MQTNGPSNPRFGDSLQEGPSTPKFGGGLLEIKRLCDLVEAYHTLMTKRAGGRILSPDQYEQLCTKDLKGIVKGQQTAHEQGTRDIFKRYGDYPTPGRLVVEYTTWNDLSSLKMCSGFVIKAKVYKNRVLSGDPTGNEMGVVLTIGTELLNVEFDGFREASSGPIKPMQLEEFLYIYRTAPLQMLPKSKFIIEYTKSNKQ